MISFILIVDVCLKMAAEEALLNRGCDIIGLMHLHMTFVRNLLGHGGVDLGSALPAAERGLWCACSLPIG
jgi:hypothetical protein